MMAEFNVIVENETIRVDVGENTAVALAAASTATTQAGNAAASAVTAGQARDVAIAAGVQYPTEAAAVAALADGAFGSYLDANGNPVWGQRDGSSMVPLPGSWIDISKIGIDAPPLKDLTTAIGFDEAQRAINLEPRRVTIPNGTGTYVVRGEDAWPLIHYAQPGSGTTIAIDADGLENHRIYRFACASPSIGGRVTISCGDDNFFKAAWVSPAVINVRSITLIGGESCTIYRIGTAFWVEKETSSLQVTAGASRYQRQPDGSYHWWAVRTFSIGATLESTANAVSEGFTLDSALVESITYLPNAGGTAPPDLLPQVTKIGTAGSLDPRFFAIRNPNAVSITHPILVKFINVLEA